MFDEANGTHTHTPSFIYTTHVLLFMLSVHGLYPCRRLFVCLSVCLFVRPSVRPFGKSYGIYTLGSSVVLHEAVLVLSADGMLVL